MKENSEKPVDTNLSEPCRSCASACCGPWIKIVLSDKERDFLRSAGTIISLVDPSPFPENAGINLYSLDSKCGFVENNDGLYRCSVHDDPRRPVVCGDVKAGGEDCRKIKEERRKGIGYEFGY
jgi:hypothetical protein